MTLKQVFSLVLGVFFLGLISCNSGPKLHNEHKGAIVLGDSSTIVTETDTAYLSDRVADLESNRINSEDTSGQAKDTSSKPTDTIAQTTEKATQQPVQPGLFTVNFGQGVTVSFSDLTTRTFQQQNPEQDAGVSYSITSGNLSGSTMTISGLKNIQVEQRYQSYLILKSGSKKLSLQNIGGYLSDWQTLSASGGDYSLSGLNNLDFKKVSHHFIRNATSKAAHASRLNRRETDFWLHAIRRVRSAKDAPCRIKLDNVQWRIFGQTTSGRNFHKTIRMDI